MGRCARLIAVLLGASVCATFAQAQAVRLQVDAGRRRIDLGASSIPMRSAANAGLLETIGWRGARRGVRIGRLVLRAGIGRTTVEAILVELDPRDLRFALQSRTEPNGMTGTWSLDSAPAHAVVAANAGQFRSTGPWGWLVIDGEERRDAQRAPLAVSIRIDSAGRVRWQPPGRPARPRTDAATSFAFQSFPLLLFDGRVPAAARDPALSDMGHRDARLVLAERADGHVLLVLTRYATFGPIAGRVPIGLTLPESIALACALGLRHAVMLDGGVSAQLMVRDSTGGVVRWPGLRKVPLALLALPRAPH